MGGCSECRNQIIAGLETIKQNRCDARGPKSVEPGWVAARADDTGTGSGDSIADCAAGETGSHDEHVHVCPGMAFHSSNTDGSFSFSRTLA